MLPRLSRPSAAFRLIREQLLCYGSVKQHVAMIAPFGAIECTLK